MVMSNEEICREYRQAKDQHRQIGILADQNKATKAEIVEILRASGEKVTGNYKPKKPSEAAALKEAEQPELVVHGLDGEPARVIKAETPEAPVVNKDILLDALVKSNKKVTALEDILDIFVGAIEDFREAPEEIDRPELAKSTLSYMCGVVDAFKAINGPIIR